MAKYICLLRSEITLFQMYHIDAFAADNYAFSFQLYRIYGLKEMYIFKIKFYKKQQWIGFVMCIL